VPDLRLNQRCLWSFNYCQFWRHNNWIIITDDSKDRFLSSCRPIVQKKWRHCSKWWDLKTKDSNQETWRKIPQDLKTSILKYFSNLRAHSCSTSFRNVTFLFPLSLPHTLNLSTDSFSSSGSFLSIFCKYRPKIGPSHSRYRGQEICNCSCNVNCSDMSFVSRGRL
jgi:hypothetical protein